MGENVKNIKIAKNLQKGSLTVIVGSLNDGKFNFDISNWKNFENRTINTKDMRKNVENKKIA